MQKLAILVVVVWITLSCGLTDSLAAEISVTNSIPGFFDGSSGYRDFEFKASDTDPVENPMIQNVTISVTFGKHDGEAFGVDEGGLPYLDEIVMRLISPEGTTVSLIEQGTFSHGDTGFLNRTVTFDQRAVERINVDENNVAAGTFRPLGNLDVLAGESALGIFRLFVMDATSIDGLDFISATITVDVDSAPAVPEPSTMALAICGLLAGGLAHIKRRKMRLQN